MINSELKRYSPQGPKVITNIIVLFIEVPTVRNEVSVLKVTALFEILTWSRHDHAGPIILIIIHITISMKV